MPDPSELPADVIISPDARRADRVPPGQKETKHWPVLHEGAIPKIETSAWRLRIDGLVERPWECDWEQRGYHRRGDPWSEQRFG